MNTHLHPTVLQARFVELAATWQPGAAASGVALDAIGRQAHAALRGLDAVGNAHDNTRLGCAVARLARKLIGVRGGAVALEHGILRLGIERGRYLNPVDIATTVRSVRDGSAQRHAAITSGVDLEAAQAKLFMQIALVALLAGGGAA